MLKKKRAQVRQEQRGQGAQDCDEVDHESRNPLLLCKIWPGGTVADNLGGVMLVPNAGYSSNSLVMIIIEGLIYIAPMSFWREFVIKTSTIRSYNRSYIGYFMAGGVGGVCDDSGDIFPHDAGRPVRPAEQPLARMTGVGMPAHSAGGPGE